MFSLSFKCAQHIGWYFENISDFDKSKFLNFFFSLFFIFWIFFAFEKILILLILGLIENFFYPPPPPQKKKKKGRPFFCQKTLFFTTKNFWSWKIGFFDKKRVDYFWVFFFFGGGGGCKKKFSYVIFLVAITNERKQSKRWSTVRLVTSS